MAKPKARPTKSAKSAKSSANRLRDDEYKRLISRAETVGKQLEAADDDEAYKLEEGAWAKVIDSFDAWARKYHVKVETSRHGHGRRQWTSPGDERMPGYHKRSREHLGNALYRHDVPFQETDDNGPLRL